MVVLRLNEREQEQEHERMIQSGYFCHFIGTTLLLWLERMVGALSVTRHQRLHQIIKLVNKTCRRDATALWRVSPVTIRNGRSREAASSSLDHK